MELPICALIAWLTIVWFSLTPKQLSVLDLVFLYCAALMISTTTHTVFDVDLHLVTVSRAPASSFSAIISRMVTIPLLVMMAVNALYLSNSGMTRWSAALLPWFVLIGFDWVLTRIHVITYHNWGVWQASLVYVLFIAGSYMLIRWFKRFDGRINT